MARIQKTPKVDRADVLRVVERDFPINASEVLSILSNIRGIVIKTDRLHLAHLKNSEGSLEKLHESLAIGDQRDVVCCAEYPNYMKLGWVAIGKLPLDEKHQIIDLDWQQYQRWLNAE